MASIKVREGIEGPAYDPYHFTEIQFTRTDGVVVTLHAGLGDWLTLTYGLTGWVMGKGNPDEAFARLTGITPAKAMQIWERRHHPSRCPKCKSRKQEWFAGYPGEQICQCSKCGSFIACTFDPSVVE